MNKTKYITVVFFACLFGCRKASAQALPTATAPGAYISVGTTYSFFESGYGQQKVQGTGVYVDINPIRAVGIEAEGRWLKQGQSPRMSQSTYLVGPRVHLRRAPYTPYFTTLFVLNYF